MHIESGSDLEILSGGTSKITTAKTMDINSGGNHTETAKEIHMNGPVAQKATPLTVFKMPNYSPTDGEITMDTILKRVPGHEPWPHHENLDPLKFTPAETDITSATPLDVIPKGYNTYVLPVDTFKQGK